MGPSSRPSTPLLPTAADHYPLLTLAHPLAPAAAGCSDQPLLLLLLQQRQGRKVWLCHPQRVTVWL